MQAANSLKGSVSLLLIWAPTRDSRFHLLWLLCGRLSRGSPFLPGTKLPASHLRSPDKERVSGGSADRNLSSRLLATRERADKQSRQCRFHQRVSVIGKLEELDGAEETAGRLDFGIEYHDTQSETSPEKHLGG